MSYSGIQNYGAYYGNSPNDQNAKDAYNVGRSPGTTASIPAGTAMYQASTMQPQYNGGGYTWPGQSQQTYGTVSGDAQSHGNNAWRGGANGQHSQQPAYDFQRQQIIHSNLNANPGAGQGFYSSTSQPATQQSTQRLNHLAYASGLESAGLHDGIHGAMTGEAGPVASNAHRNTGISQARVSSPAPPSPQTYSNQKAASAYSSHTYNQSESSQQDLVASAAAALAGVVSRRQANQQSPAVAHNPPSTSTLSMGNAPSREGYSAQPSHRAAPPYDGLASNTSRGTQQSGQHNQAPSSQYTNLQTHRYNNISSLDPKNSRPATKPQAQSRIGNEGPPSSQGWSNISHNTAQNNSSIANLVTKSSPQESLSAAPQQQITPTESMPSFIDPSRVFNPYHKEYERRKREVAEAEAEAEAEACRKTAEKAVEGPAQSPEIGSQIVVPTESTALHPAASSAGAPEKLQKAGKGREKKPGPVPPATNSPKTSTSSQMIADADADMASEMKAMLERMREWKNKDPSMFSKLWEEMKKSSTATSAPTRSTPMPSPQVAQAELSRNPSTNISAAQRVHSPGLPAQLNGYKVVIENNDEGLPDLGRFPAERRYRQSYSKKDANVVSKRDDISSTVIDPSLAQTVAPRPQSVPQPLQAQTSTGNTIWPEEKRNALAEAAVKALNAEPANQGKGITTQTIRDMLEQNPSYIDLCKTLEDRGLRFHRGQFARQLLSNVPDLATTQNKAVAAQPPKPVRTIMAPSSTRPALAQTTPIPSTAGVPYPYVNGSHVGPMKIELPPLTVIPNSQCRIQTPDGYAPHPFSTSKPFGTPMPQAAKPRLDVPSPILQPPVPGSKDALSRKRNFSELVDLTQLSDDEDYVMPSKQPRLEEPSPEHGVFNVGTDTSAHDSPSAGQPLHGRPAFVQSLQFNPHHAHPVHAPSTQAAQRPRAILTRPINKSEALRKSYYDPKTVARDILIAAGRHPLERPLNAHYAGLLHRHIELDSDLSTFDWDAVDPGGPPMPRVKMVDIPAGPPKWKVGVQRRGPRPTREDEPIREPPVHHANPTPAITSLSRLSAQTKSLLQDSQRAVNTAAPNPSRLRHSQLVSDTSQDGIGTNVTPQKRRASLTQSPPPSQTRSSRSASLREPNSVESERKMENPSGKRRGRPPGAKNKHPSLAAMKKAANTSPLVSTPSRPSSPPPAHFGTYDCQWRKCDAKLHNLGTLRKHVSKVHRPSTEEAIKWGHTCWWKKCRTLVRNEDKTVTPKERFQSQSEWMDHIDEDHLHTLGMEKGDGPSTSHIGKPQLKPFDVHRFVYRPRDDVYDPLARTVSYTDLQSIAADRATYLSDERGRAVTAPSTNATNNLYAPDALILAPVSTDAEERVPIKQYMRAHGNEKMDLKTSASETLRAMEVKKERVGPGMDRGGCTLVNNERRATLLHNEGIARVVMDDD